MLRILKIDLNDASETHIWQATGDEPVSRWRAAMATATNPFASHTHSRASAVLARVAVMASLWRKRRRERAELAWCSERDLHDAGTSRAALEYELAKPFWHQ
jgi:uncharacterized protein YjiS (DUF1127 family)